MRLRFILIAIFGLFVAGCANSNSSSNYASSIKTTPVLSTNVNLQKAEKQLTNSATSIQNSLTELAEIQKAVYPAVQLPDLPDADKLGMGHLASIDWTGPIEPLVRNIAKVTYYQLRIIGKPPAIPVIVSLSEKNVPLAVILRDAAYQCGNRVNIVVYPRSRIVELRYANV